ncbi:hypothetical protein [Dysgonomonas mossii]|uniref:Uncharacterized protein n=1 Tax=Dysgonomonas mossii DSM 22836 TaxID=742767 RepID=F8X3U5_9BACT|nr:hypothetical protein [Dysgonomonas mossii]EGK05234.1 hypothetical protein HMPREF9456_02904 [Dysgonomonas mossii DSM 22836]
MKDKCYLIKSISPYIRRGDTLELVNKYLYVSINEDWEYAPNIEISYSEEYKSEVTLASEYAKVKRIIPEIFNSYYTSTIRKLSESFSENGEYYFKYSIKACNLYLFTDSKHVTIDINNDIDNFYCNFSRYRGIRGRNTARKELDTLPEEVMRQLFNLTIELLHDPQNLKNLKDEYYKQLSLLIENREPIKGLILNADIVFNEVRTQIIDRIESIENRMINFDDTVGNRNELRGELKGLKYCLKILDSNR